MQKTFPKDRKLSNAERVRIFEADQTLLRGIAEQSGLTLDEVKRRGIHVGLPKLARFLGIELPTDTEPKAA